MLFRSGLPPAVLARARALLKILEAEQLATALAGGSVRKSAAPADQLGLFTTAAVHPVVERLRGIDPNQVTPLEALALLAELVSDARVEDTDAPQGSTHG